MAMTSSGTATVTLPTDTQIQITREFDAPKHLVYKAWTTPELVKRWWHANRGEMTTCEIDLRVGGVWRYVMVAEGFGEVGFHGEYR
ncbi:MAG: SRPBCC domain-containing protein, partial [Gaiellaceae bacterium]